MDQFDCKVRLAGSVGNEVRKELVTAAQIIILRHIHGEDSVLDIVGRPEVKRGDTEERDRLAKEYGALKVAELFGPVHNPLPKTVPGLVDVKPRMERAPKSKEELAA
jgi:hypothetical protein